jgi:hypothetical protein
VDETAPAIDGEMALAAANVAHDDIARRSSRRGQPAEKPAKLPVEFGPAIVRQSVVAPHLVFGNFEDAQNEPDAVDP